MGLFFRSVVGNKHKIKKIINSREYARILDTNLTCTDKNLNKKIIFLTE